MIPLKDDAPRIGTPFINYTLIALNVLAFLFEIFVGSSGQQQLVFAFGMVPARITVVLFNHGYVPWDLISGLGTRYVPAAAAIVPIFASMFLHASWWHLLGNMLFLWIFGDNVEDILGHFKYLLFYLVCGVAAALLHTSIYPNSAVPTVGASGAIAGVMGAYFLLYPRAKVLTLVGLPYLLFFFVWLPAWAWLGFWFVWEFLQGAAAAITARTSAASGIAFWAHVGGFVTGVLLIKLFPVRTRRYHYGL